MANSKPHQSLTDDIIIRSIKIMDIGYITLIYFFLAFVLSIMIDKALGDYISSEQTSKSTFRIFIEICIHMWLIGILIYAARNIVELIPSPFDGIHGFVHDKVKELHMPQVFTVIILYYQVFLHDKMMLLYQRWGGPKG